MSKPRKFINYSEWHEILSLGKRLLELPTINDRRNCIIETSERLLNCRVELLLSNQAFSILLDSLSGLQGVLEIDNSPLMTQAVNENRPVVEDTTTTVPLLADQTIIGVLKFNRVDNPFTALENSLIEGIAVQSAIALESSRQRALDHHQVELLSLVRKVSSQIANVFDLDELSRRITTLILFTFHYYYVAIFTTDNDRETLCFRASAGPSPKEDSNSEAEANKVQIVSPPLPIKPGEGIISRAAELGQEVLAKDVSQNPHYHYLEALPETKSEVALPLKVSDRILGVLDVQSDHVDAFKEMDILVLHALADSIAIAIENANLYNDLNRHADLLSSIAEIGNAITSILDQGVLLNSIVTLIHKRFSYPLVQIYTVQQGLGKITLRATSSEYDYENGGDETEYILDENDVISWVVQNGKTFLVNDSEASPLGLSRSLPANTRSELIVPLIFGDQPLGILDLYSNQSNAFRADDIFLFEALADHIAVALRNANLYRTEQWRRQVAEGMREIAGLLSADIELDQVLDRILTELERNLPCDAAAIWLLENTESDEGTEQFTSSLNLAAVHSNIDLETLIQSQANQNAFDGIDLRELVDTHARVSSLSPWIISALESSYPITRTSDSPTEPLGTVLNLPKDYSAIAAPLRTGDQTIGLLVLVHRMSGRYGSESQAMTATFANYAAVAIENTRLYEAAHDQAWVSTVLLQVAEATQSLTSLNELLETVVNIIPQLVGVNACALLTWDKKMEAFIPAASHGLTPETQVEFERWYILEGEVPIFDEVRSTQVPTILSPSSIATNSLFTAFDLDKDLLVLFPMVSQAELQGLILVDFSSSYSEDDDIYKLWDQKFAIIQGIAHQTAIAVENIRLLEAQEEEAYVSIALLQVAQAVVSQTDLDDVLSAIVRITPILVGVRRCIIYLWDEENNVYKLSQSYGISKNELTNMLQEFNPDEFPLLDSVRQNNRLAYYYIGNATETLSDWEELSLDQFGIFQDISPESEDFLTPSTTKEFLRRKNRLLLGLPLSVRKNVLGVMLIEEEESQRGIPSYHIREKRLEIVIGICQQAALAIQNDLLQREVLERERMERELQLAREIQKTFMPEKFPILNGWDLDVRWIPARQVGGDFYDILELPGGRLGLVIADVADKGMPAALFMTLVRTLLRAAVKDNLSPAEVLSEVNDLLVPDAKGGMFVTLTYAVLSLETGILKYANAGHNPPMLFRSRTRSLEDLPRTGMALGVFEGIELTDSEVQIDAEDCLILYTDGITEALSPQDDFFGIQRLRDAVLTKVIESSKSIADTIENSLNEFVNGAPRSDDLTLIALLRKKGNLL